MHQWVQNNHSHREDNVIYLSRCFNIDPLVIRLLLSRGHTTENQISKFLYSEIKDLYDPFLLNDMDKAVYRIVKARKNKETIIIFGDYDADGITSSSILCSALKALQINVTVVIPNRKDGYGLSENAIGRLQTTYNPSLIVTVDNGSNAHEALALAKLKGIDVIVTDHHEITAGTPSCYAFINPMRSDSTYPFQRLAGVGVALKLIQAIFQFGKIDWQKHLWKYLELAAIGTVADVMPLVDENRTIVSLGLEKLNNNPSEIFKQWKKLLKISYFKSSDIAFTIAPMINASGRVDDPNSAVSIFVSNSVDTSDLIYFENVNKKRKSLAKDQFEQLDLLILDQKLNEDNVIVAQGDFDEGIIGILAAKSAEKYLKPSIIIDANGKGSARSVQNTNFSIIKTIQRASKFLIKFGGHQAAAGLSMDVSHISDFRNAIQISAKEEPGVAPVLLFDYVLSIEDFPKSLIDDLEHLEPTGMGNLKPVFKTFSSIDHSEVFGTNNEHLKIRIKGKEALLFSKGSSLNDFTRTAEFNFLYTVNSKRDFLIHHFSM